MIPAALGPINKISKDLSMCGSCTESSPVDIRRPGPVERNVPFIQAVLGSAEQHTIHGRVRHYAIRISNLYSPRSTGSCKRLILVPRSRRRIQCLRWKELRIGMARVENFIGDVETSNFSSGCVRPRPQRKVVLYTTFVCPRPYSK